MVGAARLRERPREVFSLRQVALLAETPQNIADRAMAGRVLALEAGRACRPALAKRMLRTDQTGHV